MRSAEGLERGYVSPQNSQPSASHILPHGHLVRLTPWIQSYPPSEAYSQASNGLGVCPRLDMPLMRRWRAKRRPHVGVDVPARYPDGPVCCTQTYSRPASDQVYKNVERVGQNFFSSPITFTSSSSYLSGILHPRLLGPPNPASRLSSPTRPSTLSANHDSTINRKRGQRCT